MRQGRRDSMRRLAATMISVLAMTPVTAGASHSPAASDEGPRDFAVGAGSNEFLVVLGSSHFALSATRDARTGRLSGHVTAYGDPDGPGPLAPFKVDGEVTCLRVSGNRAALKWRFRHARGSAEPLEGGGVEAFVEDNARPRFGAPIDRAGLGPPQPQATFDVHAGQCDDPTLHPTYDPIDSGNITVHDGASP